MAPKKIGILGGMGPQATILLQERLLNAVTAQDDIDHIPLMIDMNPQIPSRIKWLIEGQGEDPVPALLEMTKRLQDSGAEALAMPCNTAHAFAVQIEQAAKIPFFNMPDLAAADVAKTAKAGDGIGILASPATQMTGLFSNALAPHGLNALYPSDQAPMLAAIKRIKADGPGPEALNALNVAAAELANAGAAALLVGCSEFSLLTQQIAAPVPVIDTMDVLTRHLVAFAFGDDGLGTN